MKLFSSIATLLGLGLAAGCAATRPAISVDLPVASRYMFRGVVLDKNPVIQPSLRVEEPLAGGTLGAGLWSNFELSNDRGLENHFTEYDTTLDYSRTLGRIDFSAGASRYEYPNTDVSGSTELFATLAVNGLALTPAFEAWYDCDQVDGAYCNFNLSRDFELAEDWTVSAVAGLGWMDDAMAASFFGVKKSGLSDGLLQATLQHPLGDHVTISAVAAASRVLGSDYRDSVTQPDNVWFALGATVTF